MHCQNLVASLYEYKDRYPTEQNIVNQIIEFVQSTPGCFYRSQLNGHLTGSAWLVNDQQQVLLTHHKKLQMWIQLGGHCDGNPSTMDVALNEAREESGLRKIKPLIDKIFDVDIHLIPENPREQAHYHYDIRYLLTSGLYTDFKISNESISLAWLSTDEISSYSDEPSLLRMKNKYLKYLRERSH